MINELFRNWNNDLLSQYVFHAGMFGIGIASGLSYLAALCVCAGFFLKESCPFRFSSGGIRLGTALDILRAGSPVLLTQFFYVMRIYASNLILLCDCRGDCHSGMFLTPHHLAVFRGKRSDLQHRAFRLSPVYA